MSSLPRDPARACLRVLKTGDLGRRIADGLIEFLGRADQQIKLRGHRVVVTEIESAIAALPQVEDAAVVVRRGKGNVALALVAYVVIRNGIRGILGRHLQSILARQLPRYMVPALVFFIEALPRLANSKLDRQGLADMDLQRSWGPEAVQESPMVEEIAAIFRAVIGVDVVTPNDTVASLGGDSMQEVTIQAELEKRYGFSTPFAALEVTPTVREIATLIDSERKRTFKA